MAIHAALPNKDIVNRLLKDKIEDKVTLIFNVNVVDVFVVENCARLCTGQVI